jgi:hypothetical protein
MASGALQHDRQRGRKAGAERRYQAEREPIRDKARAMRAALGLPATAALVPTLILTNGDRI